MPMTLGLRREEAGPASRRRRASTTAFSLAGHVAVVGLLLTLAPAAPPARLAPPSIRVALVEPLRPRLDPTPAETISPAEPEPPKVEEKTPEEKPSEARPRPEAPRPSPVKAPPKTLVARATVTEPTPDAVAVGGGSTGQGMAEVGDGDLAGATTAGNGGGGGACNMTRRLQDALRKDRRAQAAVAEVNRGKALLVWNGEWVRHPAQEGAGLAALREAIMWEVGFAPEECRTQAMNGLVLISLTDGSRVALGHGRWRWSDLLFARGIRPSGGA